MDWNLSPEELRVLGSLVEKESTTPEQYPLSVNALRNACNQKSSRDPVMDLPESSVREAVTSLTRRGLVRMGSGYGGRVSKFAHRFGTAASGLELGPDQVAVLCVLFLRGPQTPGELRTRTQRLHAFENVAAIEATLTALAEHPQGPLVQRLAREPGRREHRFAHCFGAEPGPAETGSDAAQPPPKQRPDHSPDDLEARVAALEQGLRAVQEQIERLAGGTDDPEGREDE